MPGFSRIPSLLPLFGLVLVAACSAGDMKSCPDDYETYTEYRIFFGRGAGEVESVDDAEWDQFLADTITPRFPGGLTVFDGAGQWQESETVIHKELTKIVVILTPRDGSVSVKLDEISQEYKRRYDHPLVLVTTEDSCAAFN